MPEGRTQEVGMHMMTILCQPASNHPGKLHLTRGGKKTLCGRDTRGKAWGPATNVDTYYLDNGYVWDECDCQRCLKAYELAKEEEKRPVRVGAMARVRSTVKAISAPIQLSDKAKEYADIIPHVINQGRYNITRENIEHLITSNTERQHLLSLLNEQAKPYGIQIR